MSGLAAAGPCLAAAVCDIHYHPNRFLSPPARLLGDLGDVAVALHLRHGSREFVMGWFKWSDGTWKDHPEAPADATADVKSPGEALYLAAQAGDA